MAEGAPEKEMAAPADANQVGMLLSQFRAAKEWIGQRRESVKPWNEFLSSKAGRPKSTGAAVARLRTNLMKFQSNYLFVCLGLAVYCV